MLNWKRENSVVEGSEVVTAIWVAELWSGVEYEVEVTESGVECW